MTDNYALADWLCKDTMLTCTEERQGTNKRATDNYVLTDWYERE